MSPDATAPGPRAPSRPLARRLALAVALLLVALLVRQPEETGTTGAAPADGARVLPDHPPGAELIDSFEDGAATLARLVDGPSYGALVDRVAREFPRLTDVIAALRAPPADWRVTKKDGAVVVRPRRAGWTTIILVPDPTLARITRVEARGPDGFEQFELAPGAMDRETLQRLSELGYTDG